MTIKKTENKSRGLLQEHRVTTAVSQCLMSPAGSRSGNGRFSLFLAQSLAEGKYKGKARAPIFAEFLYIYAVLFLLGYL